MSDPNSPMDENGDRTYRFISDPGHKENLSGRVRAACLTCRRKKIKCSGEVNCRTCREKGLVCEGLPERKRPSKDAGTSVILNPVASGIGRKGRTSPSRRNGLRRPSAPLRAADSSDSHDSGYFSLRESAASPATSATTNDSNVDTTPDFSLPLQEPKPTHRNAQPGLQIDTWHLDESYVAANKTHDYTQPAIEDDLAGFYQASSSAVSETDVDWSHFQQGDSWWSSQHMNDSQDLVPAVQALGDQAQSLSLMANRQLYNDPSINPMRRQTVMFPLESPSAFEQHLNVLDNQPSVFDDMALLLTNRTPRTGLTPNVTEFASWWDINGVGDMSAFFGNSHAHVSISGGLNDRTPHDASDMTNTMEGPLDQPNATDATCFARYWIE